MSNQDALAGQCPRDAPTLWSGMAANISTIVNTTAAASIQQSLAGDPKLEPVDLHVLLRKLSQDASSFVDSLNRVCHVASQQAESIATASKTDICKEPSSGIYNSPVNMQQTAMVNQKLNLSRLAFLENVEKGVQAKLAEKVTSEACPTSCAVRSEQAVNFPSMRSSTAQCEEIQDEVVLKVKIVRSSEELESDSYKTGPNELFHSDSSESQFSIAQSKVSDKAVGCPENGSDESVNAKLVETDILETEVETDHFKNTPNGLTECYQVNKIMLKPSCSTILEIDETSLSENLSGRKESQSPLSSPTVVPAREVCKSTNDRKDREEKEEIITSFLNLLSREISTLTEEGRLSILEKTVGTNTEHRRKKKTYSKAIMVEELKPNVHPLKLGVSTTFSYEIRSETALHTVSSTKLVSERTDAVSKRTESLLKSVAKRVKKRNPLNGPSDPNTLQHNSKPPVKKVISQCSTGPDETHSLIAETYCKRGPLLAEKLFERAEKPNTPPKREIKPHIYFLTDTSTKQSKWLGKKVNPDHTIEDFSSDMSHTTKTVRRAKLPETNKSKEQVSSSSSSSTSIHKQNAHKSMSDTKGSPKRQKTYPMRKEESVSEPITNQRNSLSECYTKSMRKLPKRVVGVVTKPDKFAQSIRNLLELTQQQRDRHTNKCVSSPTVHPQEKLLESWSERLSNTEKILQLLGTRMKILSRAIRKSTASLKEHASSLDNVAKPQPQASQPHKPPDHHQCTAIAHRQIRMRQERSTIVPVAPSPVNFRQHSCSRLALKPCLQHPLNCPAKNQLSKVDPLSQIVNNLSCNRHHRPAIATIVP